MSLQSLGVVIDINAVVLFDSAQADLAPGALELIERLAGVLKGLNYPIQINGFTDNAQIHTAQFSSNWDLSAARAISVVKRFAEDGVDPLLLVGAGYGEYHPVASNDTPEGKAMNRRVSIVVVSPIQDQNLLRTPIIGDPARLDHAADAPGGSANLSGPTRPETRAPVGGCGGIGGGSSC